MNTYGYALGNPLYFFDSLGLAEAGVFETPEDAGKAAVCAINCKSIFDKAEYSGPICKIDRNKYTYGPPIKGGSSSADVGGKMPCPSGDNVGGYHTHANYDPTLVDKYDKGVDRNLNFSYQGPKPSDITIADDNNKLEVMGDPHCNVHVYYPGSYHREDSLKKRKKQRSGGSLGKCDYNCKLCEKCEDPQ